MGRDKALLPVAGQPLAVRVGAVLSAAGAAEVFCVGGDAVALGALGLDVRADRHPGQGPLGGVVTALAEADRETVVVLSCDLVAVTPEVVTTLLRLLEAEPAAAVAVPVAEGRRQYLCGAYRRAAVSVWLAAFDGGERAVWRAARNLGVAEHDGLDASWLRDADVPEDLPGDDG